MLYTICMYVCIQHGILFDRLVGSGWYPSRSDGSNFRCEQLPPSNSLQLPKPPFSRLCYPLPISRHQFSRLFFFLSLSFYQPELLLSKQTKELCNTPGQQPKKTTFCGSIGEGCVGGVNLPLPSLYFPLFSSSSFRLVYRQDARSNSLDD